MWQIELGVFFTDADIFCGFLAIYFARHKLWVGFCRSAGLSSDGSVLVDNESCRPISCPPGEINITDIELGTSCASLFTAAGNNVRTWDLRMWVPSALSLSGLTAWWIKLSFVQFVRFVEIFAGGGVIAIISVTEQLISVHLLLLMKHKCRP